MNPYILITGIGRSGTSFLCGICNEFSNAVIMNEPPLLYIPSEPERIKELFDHWYKQVLNREKTHMVVRKSGGQIEDTLKETNNKTSRGIYKIDNDDFIFGIKSPIPSLNRIPIYRKVFPECRYICCVRNPFDTIGSMYNVAGNGPELEPINYWYYKETDRWKDIEAIRNAESKEQKSALIWKFHSDTILENLDIFILARYHENVTQPQTIVNKIYKGLNPGKQLREFKPNEPRRSSQYLNDETKYWIEKICKENAEKLNVWNK